MKKLLLLSFLLFGCRTGDMPEARTITDHFVGYWWELNVLGYNECFKLQEEGDRENPVFLKSTGEVGQELFGTWIFEPPNTFHIYEDGEDPPYEVYVYEDNDDCWVVEWGSLVVPACPCGL
tara:strand:+ start:899 stop:1261 length:363 start_codon:yes stop_codon:yes gene_type:complete